MIVIKKAILTKMSIAVPDKCLKPFCNRVSNALDTKILIIFSLLMDKYGRVLPEELEEVDQKLQGKVFEFTKLLVTMYQEIEDLEALAKVA